MKIIVIIISVYLLSVLWNRRWVRKAYSKGGKYEKYRVDKGEMYFTFFPIVNTAIASKRVFEATHDRDKNYNKYFGLKDEEYKR